MSTPPLLLSAASSPLQPKALCANITVSQLNASQQLCQILETCGFSSPVCQDETAEDSTDEMLAKLDNLGRLKAELNVYSSRIPAALSLYKQYL